MDLDEAFDLSFREIDVLVYQRPAAALAAAHDWLASHPTDRRIEPAAHSLIARALFELGQIPGAAAAARRAVALSADIGAGALAGAITMSSAAILAEAGAVDEALGQLDRLAESFDAEQRPRLDVQRAYVLHHAGRLDEGLAALTRAEPALRAAGDEHGLIRLLQNRGLLRVQVGELDTAEADFTAALALAERLDLTAARALSASNLGVLHGRARRIAESMAWFERAAIWFEAAGRPTRLMAIMHLDRAEVAMHTGLVDDAVDAARRVVESVTSTGNLVLLGDCQLMLARCLLAAGDLSAARRAAALAAESLGATGRSAMLAQARAIEIRAGARRHHTGGFDAADEVIAELEHAGWSTAAIELRMARLVWAAEQGRLDETSADIEALRSLVSSRRDVRLAVWYAEALALRPTRPERALDACRSGLDVLDEIVAEAPTLEVRSAAMRLGNELSQLAIDLAIELDDIATVLAAAEGTRARALHDELARPGHHHPLTEDGARQLWSDVERCIESRVLVEWVTSAGQVSAVVVGAGWRRLVRVASIADVLRARDRVVAWLDRAAEDPDISSAGAERAVSVLDSLLLAPLDLPDTTELVVVPVGALHGIPWGALPTVADRIVSVSASVRLWLEAISDTGQCAAAVVIVGPEIGADRERRAVVDRLAGRVIDGAAATAAAMRRELSDPQLVHVAAHGSFRADHPLLSTVRLVDGEATLYEALPERVGARIVVLSSCSGGASGVAEGAEVLGLSAVLLARGASAVLAPLTTVRELECAEFVTDVHHELAAGSTIGTAVASVRRRWLAADDLSRWAVAGGFVLFGSGAIALASERVERTW